MFLQTIGWSQIFIVISATLTIISDGMNYVWSSGSIPILKREDSPIGSITEDDALWIEEIYWIGGIMGIFISISICDRFGRKRSVLFSSMENMVSWIIIAFARDIKLIFVARFINGSASIIAFVAGPMYIAECAEPRIRGFLMTFVIAMLMLGILMSYTVLSFIPIWASSCLGACINAIHIAIFSFQPESPYFWLLKNNVTKAETSLRKLRSIENVDTELQNIKMAIERQSAERGRPIDLIKIPSNRKALIISASLAAMQHLCGVSVILMNLQMIFIAADSKVEPTTASILFAVIMLITLFVGSILVDKCGRKFLLVISCAVTSLSLGVLGIYFLLMKMDMAISNTVPMITMTVYAVANRLGISLVPVIINGEIFSSSVKSMGSAMSCLVYNIMAIFAIKMYYVATEMWGIHVPFLFFSAFAILSAILVFFFLTETKGKTLEEIQLKLKNKKSTSIAVIT